MSHIEKAKEFMNQIETGRQGLHDLKIQIETEINWMQKQLVWLKSFKKEIEDMNEESINAKKDGE